MYNTRLFRYTLACKLVLLLNVLPSIAQEVPLEYFGIDDGLAESRIDHLRIQEDGTLLLGTAGHPIVYDGYQFKIVDKERLHWFINSAHDNNGVTWLINMQGSLYGFDGQKIFNHPATDSMPRLANTRKRQISLAFDSSRTAYIGLTGLRYYVKAFQNGEVERVSIDTELRPNSAFIERRRTIAPYFGSTHRNAENDSGFIYIDGQIVHKIDRPLSGRVHYTEKDSLQVVSVGRSLFFKCGKRITERNIGKTINAIHFDAYGKLWVGHSDGAGFIDFHNSEHYQPVLSNHMVTSIVIDHEEHLWLGTTNGLFKVLTPFITNYYQAGGMRLYGESAVEMIVNRNNVTAVNRGDIFHFRGTEFQRSEVHNGPKSMTLATSSLNGFWTLYSYGTYFNNNKGSFPSGNVINASGMASYEEDSTVWLTKGHYLVQLNRKGDTLKHLKLDTLGWGNDMPDNPRVKIVGMDRYNPCLSIDMKLFIYDGDSLQKVYQEYMGKKMRYLSCAKNLGKFTVVGTKVGGLWVLHQDTFYQLGTNNGLVSDKIRDVTQENDSTWWVATNKGLQRVVFSIKNERFRYKSKLFDKTDGLPTSDISNVLVHNDTLWISTRSGISSISLNIYNTYKPKLPATRISRLQVNGADKPHSEAFDLEHTENQLSFGFRAVTYRPVKRKTYAYRLLGQSEQWRITTDTMVNYEALPAGDFVFEVRSLGDDLETFSPSSQVRFSIAKPFWQQAWFIIVAVLLAQLIAGMGVWLVNRSKRRRLSLEKSVLTAELKALRAQLNPHFMFNALGAIQGSILKGSNEEALQNIGKLAHLMRKMLHTTRNKRTSLKDAVEVLRLYLDLELVRQPNGFSYQIECDDSCAEEIETLNIPPSIIQPFVENAVLHGALKASEKGTVAVSFSQNEEYIQCTIADNGPGYYQSQKMKNPNHRSLGLTIVKEQIELLNMDLESKISLSIEEHHGTVVTVQTPIDF